MEYGGGGLNSRAFWNCTSGGRRGSEGLGGGRREDLLIKERRQQF